MAAIKGALQNQVSKNLKVRLLDSAILVLCVCFLKTCVDAVEQTSAAQAAKARFRLWWTTLHDPKVRAAVSLSELTPLVQHPHFPKERKPLGYLLCMMSSCES